MMFNPSVGVRIFDDVLLKFAAFMPPPTLPRQTSSSSSSSSALLSRSSRRLLLDLNTILLQMFVLYPLRLRPLIIINYRGRSSTEK